jgi:acetyl-CoA synthetase (ADP-forming)
MKSVEESLKFVEKFLMIPKRQVVKHVKDINIKCPLVLKIISHKFSHKTEVKGVRIIKNQEELEKNFNELMKIKGTQAILVQEFVEGTELTIGLKKDPAFGHALMFGVGGVMVELLKDVSFRICPITEKDAESMIDDLKAKELLTGFRGSKPVNLNAVKRALVNTSLIPKKHPNIKELDINPLIVNEKHAIVVDARLELD